MYPLTPSTLTHLSPHPLTLSLMYPLTPSPLTMYPFTPYSPPHLLTHVPLHPFTPHSFTPSSPHSCLLTLYPLILSLITPSLHSLTQFNSYLPHSSLFFYYPSLILSIPPLLRSLSISSLSLLTHSLPPSFTCHLMFHINGTNNQSAYLTFPPGLP